MGNSSASLIKNGFWIRDGSNFINVKKISMAHYLVVLQLLKLTLQIRLKELLSQKMLYLMAIL